MITLMKAEYQNQCINIIDKQHHHQIPSLSLSPFIRRQGRMSQKQQQQPTLFSVLFVSVTILLLTFICSVEAFARNTNNICRSTEKWKSSSLARIRTCHYHGISFRDDCMTASTTTTAVRMSISDGEIATGNDGEDGDKGKDSDADTSFPNIPPSSAEPISSFQSLPSPQKKTAKVNSSYRSEFVGEEKSKASSTKIWDSTKIWEVADGDENRLRKRDLLKSITRRLANLSLIDYSWRSSYFKRTEADRRVDESLALMMGEQATYVRPMNASPDKIGPLGEAEGRLVNWLTRVIEEEGKRARMIMMKEGEIVRPVDVIPGEDGVAPGPLSELEGRAVSFLDSIFEAERERAALGLLRPKDLSEGKRGPLGDAEAKAVTVLTELYDSESLRAQQQRLRGGEIVRPIDVPGPLGELEKLYMEVADAERQRSEEGLRVVGSTSKDGENNEKNGGWFGKTNPTSLVLRPKDATIRGPLGNAEFRAYKVFESLRGEEEERLINFRRALEENRPMEKDQLSLLGMLETVVVGLARGPVLVTQVIGRVYELLDSEPLDKDDFSRNENEDNNDDIKSESMNARP